jgi:hypothetical protein
MDYKSAYPHAFMMCNLYSPKAEGWHGDGVFKVSGVYDDKVQGEIELLIKDLFKERQLNKGGPLEYTLKIVINTMYGLSGNPHLNGYLILRQPPIARHLFDNGLNLQGRCMRKMVIPSSTPIPIRYISLITSTIKSG